MRCDEDETDFRPSAAAAVQRTSWWILMETWILNLGGDFSRGMNDGDDDFDYCDYDDDDDYCDDDDDF